MFFFPNLSLGFEVDRSVLEKDVTRYVLAMRAGAVICDILQCIGCRVDMLVCTTVAQLGRYVSSAVAGTN